MRVFKLLIHQTMKGNIYKLAKVYAVMSHVVKYLLIIYNSIWSYFLILLSLLNHKALWLSFGYNKWI